MYYQDLQSMAFWREQAPALRNDTIQAIQIIVRSLHMFREPMQTEKSPDLSVEALCFRYLVSRLGQLSFAVKKHAGGMF